MDKNEIEKLERRASVAMWLTRRASRNTGWFDRLCRWLMTRMLRLDPENDFMRDEIIDNDQGFSVEELDRYQRSK